MPARRRTRAAIVIVHPVSTTSSINNTGPDTPTSGSANASASAATRYAELAALTGCRLGGSAECPGSSGDPVRPDRRPRSRSAGDGSTGQPMTANGRCSQGQAARTATAAVRDIARDRSIRGVEQSAQARPSRGPSSRPMVRPSAGPSAIRPLRSIPILAMPVGHWRRGASSTRGVAAGPLQRRRPRNRRPRRKRSRHSYRTDRTWCRPRVQGSSNWYRKNVIPALWRGLVIQHRLLLAAPRFIELAVTRARRSARVGRSRSSRPSLAARNRRRRAL